MQKIKVGVIGGTGYTGVELLRLITLHPHAEAVAITSRGAAGTAVAEMFPALRGHCDLVFSDPSEANLMDCDVVFAATPNGVAMQHAPELLEAGVKLIDLSADFRLRDVAQWQQWYGMTHACPELVTKAVYGLPEIHRAAIKEAQLVANPGCYPTCTQLGFLPLLEAGVADTSRLIADAKSGTSGAGRKAAVGSAFCEVADSFKAYAASGHRHLPEITQGLNDMTKQDVSLIFTPHLLPINRGIHATLYVPLLADIDLQACFEARYANEPFVDVMPEGSHPDTRSVRGTNMVRIAVHRAPDTNTAIVLAVEDNLGKGAAGQAMQNLNIMFQLPETCGLQQPALMP